MSTQTIRDLPDDAHVALKLMAAAAQAGGRLSEEGFARSLWVEAARRRGSVLGKQLMAIDHQLHAGLGAEEEAITDKDIDALFQRSDESGQHASFE